MSTLYDPKNIRFDGQLTYTPCFGYVPQEGDGCLSDHITPEFGFRYIEDDEFVITNNSIVPSDSISNASIALCNQKIYASNYVDEMFLTIKGSIYAETLLGAEKGYHALKNVWKTGGSGCNNGFFKLSFNSHDGERVFQYAQVWESKPSVAIEESNFFQRCFEVTLVLQKPILYKENIFVSEEFTEGVLGGECTAVISTADGSCCNKDYNTSVDCPCPAQNTLTVINESCNQEICEPICVKIEYNDTLEPINDDPIFGTNNPFSPTSDILGGSLIFGNLTTGEYLAFKDDFYLRKNDKLEICGGSETILLNGSPIFNVLKDGYDDFPCIVGGENEFVLADSTNPDIYGYNLKYTIEFYEIL